MAKLSLDRLVKELRRKFVRAEEPYIDKQPAWLGNYNGVVDVPHKSGMVYARVQSGQVITILNLVAPSIANWPVLIGRDKSQSAVLRVLETRWVHELEDIPAYVKFHHEQHQFPGPDTVFVSRDQFLPLLVYPVGGMSVRLYGDMIYGVGMPAPIRVDDVVIDMTSYIPSSGAQYVLLETGFDGVLNFIVGTPEDSPAILQTSGTIPLPSAEAVPICAFIMFQGQTEVRRDSQRKDIVDLRMFTSSSGDAHVHAFSLDSLSDVIITTPVVGDTLVYNGTDWVNAPPATSTGGSGAELLMEDGITFPPVPLETDDGTDWYYDS